MRFPCFGFFTRQRAPRRVQRYRCTHCGRCFSERTFALGYWLKRPDLLRPVYEGLVACAAYRQLARAFGVSPSTIMNLASRLGRHGLLFLQAGRPKTAGDEALVVDGFESFEFSQYYPLHVNLAVGAESHFLYAFTDAELRRKGRMTPRQRCKRALEERGHGRPDPAAVEKQMAELVRLVAPSGSRVHIRSDEHRAYPRAFRRVAEVQVHHECTPSKAARTARNPLFPVNRMDLLARHCQANHKRETIAYSKRRASLMERFAVFAVWNNWQKSRSEKRRDATPAQALGLVERRLGTPEILATRLFPSRIRLPARWQRYYDREIPTRRIPNGSRHRLRYAY
jgi:hypothetical protein